MMDPIDISFDKLKLCFLFVRPILCILVQNVQGLLANGHLQVVPVIIFHEVDQVRVLEIISQLAE
jgi:hypothetical protein